MADTVILAEQEFSDFVLDSNFGVLVQYVSPAPFMPVIGNTYKVVWDGEAYTCEAQDASGLVEGAVFIGNAVGWGMSGNNEPFIIGGMPTSPLNIYAINDTEATTHRVAIYQVQEDDKQYLVWGSSLKMVADAIRAKTGDDSTLVFPSDFASEIANIETGGAGAKPFDCHSVTFMNGSEVLYVRSVADGDTCADPVSRGLIDTPTKESDVQYNYTFYGWGTSDGGAADDTILQNVTEDKTVYAIFTATVRTYTITWLDEDGSVLKTEQVAYGTVPSYTPEKEGFSFNGWATTPTAVTGDASYTATWIEKITFAGAAWSDIMEIVDAGEAQNYFALGDTRDFKVGNYTIPFRIVGFDHDDLADGSGKAKVTLLATKLHPTAYSHPGTYVEYLMNTANGKRYSFDSEVQNAMKQVKKTHLNTPTYSGNTPREYNYYMWVPSMTELGKKPQYEAVPFALGTKYAYFNQSSIGSMIIAGTSTTGTYFTRDAKANGFQNIYYCNTNGYFNMESISDSSERYLLLGFCI